MITPRAPRDALENVRDLTDICPVPQARVRAVLEDGKANTALARLSAATLGLASARFS